MEDSNAETEEVGGVESREEEGRVLEEGEMEGDEVEAKNVLTRGKCYMDMERGHDVVDRAR